MKHQQYALFSVPLLGGQQMQEELNAFLRTHDVLCTEKSLEQVGAMSYWVFRVQWQVDTSAALQEQRRQTPRTEEEIKKDLTEAQRAVFDKLKDMRLHIARAKGVKAFVVATNEELARFSQLPQVTPEAVGKLKGIGNGRMAAETGDLVRWYASDVQPPYIDKKEPVANEEQTTTK